MRRYYSVSSVPVYLFLFVMAMMFYEVYADNRFTQGRNSTLVFSLMFSYKFIERISLSPIFLQKDRCLLVTLLPLWID